jgi:hypothetical protein
MFYKFIMLQTCNIINNPSMKGGEKMNKKILSAIVVTILAGSVNIPVATAASPDGLGPWADTVVKTNQGLRNNGTPVLAVRSNPASMLGVAENDTVDGNFYSLGFGGTTTLAFDNGISSGVFAVEATNISYPSEMAKVEVSQDGINYYFAGTLSQDGSVPLPSQVSCGKFVRITDVSDKNIFEPTADGYDVDGVQAQGISCSTTGRMTGGGSIFTSDGARVTHGFQLRCDTADVPQNLEINWGKGNKFHLNSLTSALCTDNPAIDQGHPGAYFDTYTGKGMGKFNGVSGYSVQWTFIDAGEPGKNDSAKIVIKDPTNLTILSAEGKITQGNNQAHN